jgi:aminopeptidase C
MTSQNVKLVGCPSEFDKLVRLDKSTRSTLVRKKSCERPFVRSLRANFLGDILGTTLPVCPELLQCWLSA